MRDSTFSITKIFGETPSNRWLSWDNIDDVSDESC